jgi:excisionase family DNA binding protein
MATQDLITTAVAARRLGINRTTLTRWVQVGRIKPAMIVPGYRGHFLFSPQSVDELLDELEAQKAS